MDTWQGCACSGVRKCLICEATVRCEGLDIYPSPLSCTGIEKVTSYAKEKLSDETPLSLDNVKRYHYCLSCKKIFKYFCGSDKDIKPHAYQIENTGTEKETVDMTCRDANQISSESCSKHSLTSLGISGITLIEDFVQFDEEQYLVANINNYPWKLSQSGRRKQDFGPKANFKRKKLNVGNFSGLPECCQFVVDRMKKTKPLHDFEPVEVCHLEYVSKRGSSIDPHFDDQWLWGERLVTLSLCSDSFLSLTHEDFPETIVKIPMPQRSLIVLEKEARHTWKHAISREDIKGVRIAVTFRELTNNFKQGGDLEDIGHKITNIARSFSGTPQYTGTSEQFKLG